MKRRKILFGVLTAILLCLAGYTLYDRGRPAPVPMKQELYEGVTYRRIVQYVPRPMIAHVIVIDRSAGEFEFLVTPPDSDSDTPLNARRTSQFLDEFGVQIAINGDGFNPWWSRSLVDYYPHVGDPIAPLGLTASKGNIYSNGVAVTIGIRPALYISRQNYPSFNRKPDNIFTALSGDRMIVEQGEIVPDLNDKVLHPRTAIGINRNGRYIYLMVVDGRQPFYSDGVTYAGLAELMKEQGAYYAMALDGGGSSTMVIEGENGKPVILNSPIDLYIPGRERPVGNHFGVYVK
jgi:hypothetical protein